MNERRSASDAISLYIFYFERINHAERSDHAKIPNLAGERAGRGAGAGTGGYARRRGEDRGRLLPRPGIRHRRPARRAGRGHQPHEYLHRGPRGPGRGRLRDQKFPGGRAQHRHQLRQPHQQRAVRPGVGGHFRRQRHQGAYLAAAHAHALPQLRHPRAALRGGRDGDGQPQPQQVQRLQGVRCGRLPDHHRGRGGHPGRDRKAGRLHRRAARRF